MRWGNYLVVKRLVGSNKSHEACFDVSFGSRWTTLTLLGRKWGVPSGLKCRPCRNRVSWTQGYASVGLLLGSFICFSTFDPDYAEALQEKEAHHAPPSGQLSHGKEVHTDYSVIGIPGDGRCLFRSVAHGVCLRSGKLVSESVQRELADELRARAKKCVRLIISKAYLADSSFKCCQVADEFIRRRKETEWFIEGDFDTYVSQIRKPHVWGGEPELLMLSHVLEVPITVYMRDEKSNGLISIAEYGQEYGKENPIRVLYHGFGHYDALLFPGNKGSRSRL
ncbi:hypothetical protein Dimus_001947 [Dionaea muscipula]